MSKYIEPLIITTIAVLIVYVIGVSISCYLSLPIVKKSHTTGKCVEVMSAQSEFTCDRLPIKCELVWVK